MKITKAEEKKQIEKNFRNRFSDHLKGKKEDLDNIRERWTNLDVVTIFEYGKRLGRKKK